MINLHDVFDEMVDNGAEVEHFRDYFDISGVHVIETVNLTGKRDYMPSDRYVATMPNGDRLEIRYY